MKDKLPAITPNTVVYIENPWSGAVSQMTWREITEFCHQNIYPSQRAQWLKAAREYAARGNTLELGKMIIGS